MCLIVFIDVQYWKLLALDVGTYSTEDINSVGPKGQEIKEEIKQDYTRYQYHIFGKNNKVFLGLKYITRL